MDELTRGLQARYGSALRILGDVHPLTQFIRGALESGDPDLARLASTAYEGAHKMLHPWTDLKEPLPEELIEEYASKPVRCFLQVDGWESRDGGDSTTPPDEDGHVLTGGVRYELRNTGSPVRVQIHEASDKETVLVLLSKARAWLERGWEELTTSSSRQTISEQPTPEHAQKQRVQEEGPGSYPPPEATGSAEHEAEPPAGGQYFTIGEDEEQARGLLERAFLLSADMSRLEPEGVARVAADRPDHIGAYVEVAQQGIDWYTRFRNALDAAR